MEGLEAWQRHRRRPSVRRRPKARFGWENVPRLSGIGGGLIEVCRLWLPVPLALGERLRTPNLANLDDSLSWVSWEDLPTNMQDRQKQAGKQASKQTTRPGVGIAISVGRTVFGVGSSTSRDTHSRTSRHAQAVEIWGEGESGGSKGRSAAINDRTQETGLETPAVRGFGLVSQAWRLGAGGLDSGSRRKRVRLGSALLAGGRKRRSSQVPCAPGGGVGWAAHGGCLGGWVRCWWAGWARGGLALLSAPLEPRSWKYRLCTDGAPCTPGHTPGHPQGWDVSTDLSVWQPGQG